MKDKKSKETRRVLKETVYKAGYIIRKELTFNHSYYMTSHTAYNPNGDYIGTPAEAHYLCVKRGIVPQTIDSNHRVCSIGFSHKDGKWYGWSHRAIFGFKKGNTTKKGDCQAEYLPIGFTAKNIDDAKKMAIAFAQSVS